MTISILAAVCVLLLAAALAFLGLWLSERGRRKKGEQLLDNLPNLSVAESVLKEIYSTQEMVCQSTETITAKIESLDENTADDKLRMNIPAGLDNLMGYSMADALLAAKLNRGGDDE